MRLTPRIHRAIFLILAICCFVFEPISGPISILLGMATAMTLGNPLTSTEKTWISRLLGWSVALLGAGIPLAQVIEYGGKGILVSLLLIAVVLIGGILLGRRLGVDEETSILLSSGTAICGGSAIAATSGAIGARPESTAIALAIVFLLNASAVLIFPPLGHWLQLTPEQFGTWASLAIHDTSSVVGAALAYGEGAEVIAVPMKLARALWIIPMAAGLGAWTSRRRHNKGQSPSAAAKRPWFIAGFVILAVFFSVFPQFSEMGGWLAHAGRRGLVLVLFGIGAALTRDTLKRAGLRPFLLGCTLWGFITLTSLATLWMSAGRFQ